MSTRIVWLAAAGATILSTALVASARRAQAPLGLFTDQTDVGVPSTIGPGSASYEAATGVYTVSGGGENMWSTSDHFHYVWKKMSGDLTLSATIAFVGTQPATGTPEEHRKACLVIRQSLDSDAVYADAASHGNGLTSLQWRAEKGGTTLEVQAKENGPKRLRIEKHGDHFTMSIANPGEPFRPVDGSADVPISGDFYVGLGVSAHNTGRIETATFSDVQIASVP